MSTVLDQAANISGVVSAARRRERWTREMADTSSEEKREALREGIADLEFRFPEIAALGPGEAERFARERGHGKGARSPSHNGRTRPAARRGAKSTPAPARSKPTAKPRGEVKPKRRDGGKTGGDRRGKTRLEERARGRGRQAYRETGIPGANASFSRIAMSALGATVGLAAAYLLLTSAERRGSGGQALIGLLEGGTGLLRRVVAPVDFFGPQLSQQAYSRAIAGSGQRSNESLAAQLPQLHPIADPTPAKPLHVRPAEIGLTPAGQRHHPRQPGKTRTYHIKPSELGFTP